MSRMSCSESGPAMPVMIGFLRAPFLNAVSWSTKYSGTCPASLGQVGSPPPLPSTPWQPAQAAALALPAAALPFFTSAAEAAVPNSAINKVNVTTDETRDNIDPPRLLHGCGRATRPALYQRCR